MSTSRHRSRERVDGTPSTLEKLVIRACAYSIIRCAPCALHTSPTQRATLPGSLFTAAIYEPVSTPSFQHACSQTKAASCTWPRLGFRDCHALDSRRMLVLCYEGQRCESILVSGISEMKIGFGQALHSSACTPPAVGAASICALSAMTAVGRRIKLLLPSALALEPRYRLT